MLGINRDMYVQVQKVQKALEGVATYTIRLESHCQGWNISWRIEAISSLSRKSWVHWCNSLFIKSQAWIWLCIENDICVHRGATWFAVLDLSFHKLSPTHIICTWRSRNIMNSTSIFVRITLAMYGCVTFTKRVKYVHFGTYTISMEIFSTSFHMHECIYNVYNVYNVYTIYIHL